jgi:signal transduction histidine kinase
MPRGFRLLWLAVALGSFAQAEDHRSSWFSPALRELRRNEASLQAELKALGEPVLGQTTAEFGYLHRRLGRPPPVSPWVQVDLGEVTRIDWVALIPAQLDWRDIGRSAYGFPRRFRVDASNDPDFAEYTPIALYIDADFPDPGVSPVSLPAGGRAARYVRVTATDLAVENGQYFFALAELMVISGQRNVAIGRKVRATASVELPPRWSAANLVDGRTPLGPPIERQVPPYDGLYAGDAPAGASEHLWMQVDLGRPHVLQEVRLHPVHARIGADIPGYAFPARFRVEVADGEEFRDPETIFDASRADFSNPGNNPVTLNAMGVTARYVRFTMLAPARGVNRFGLSELEVYSQDRNVARGGRVDATRDHSPFSGGWPKAQLVDGFTSYGKLIELPAYLAGWKRRGELQAELKRLEAERTRLTEEAQRRLLWGGAGAATIGAAATLGFMMQQRRRRARELEQLRTRLARDLHDEIGSNLAGLAVLSETIANGRSTPESARGDWLTVNRVARETTDAMREVLWVVGAREETGTDLLTQLQRTAGRMLAGREVVWREASLDGLPREWPADARRQVFLFFKEALANVGRHSGATRIELVLAVQDGMLELQVRDNGCGFDAARPRGMGIDSLHARAHALQGECTIESAAGAGTCVTLRVPVEIT